MFKIRTVFECCSDSTDKNEITPCMILGLLESIKIGWRKLKWLKLERLVDI